jgi:hypothetical protein
VDKVGVSKFIYDDQMLDFMEGADCDVRRVSYVEPNRTSWSADMHPVSPGTVLGPFKTRKEALDAERSWIEKKLLKKE